MMTLQQLAKLAEVSPSTVSKALNHSRDISAETRERIIALADRHGYQKKPRQKCVPPYNFSGPKIGLIYSDVRNPYYAGLLECCSTRIREMDGVMISCDANFSTERAASLCKFLDQQCKVDGIVSLYGACSLTALPRTRAPVVGSVNCEAVEAIAAGSIPCDYVCCNARTGLIEAVQTLKNQGHRRIGFLGDARSHVCRMLFEDVLQQLDLPILPELIRETEVHLQDSGFELMQQMLRKGHVPTAVVCSQDAMAAGAAKAIRGAGLRIPEDVSILGYGNTRVRLGNGKLLASINSFGREQVDMVLDLLMKRITAAGEQPVRNVCLQTTFLPGDTIGPAPE